MNDNFFNLYDKSQGIYRSLAEGVTTRIFPGHNAMLSVVRLKGDAESALHSHPEEQWGVVLEGDGVRTQDNVLHQVSAGDFWQTPGGMMHSFRAGPNGALLLDIFSPPRAEYQMQGSGVNT